MSSTVVSLLLAIGVSGWVYSKTSRSTGGNTQSAITAAAATGILAFIVMWIVMGFIPSN